MSYEATEWGGPPTETTKTEDPCQQAWHDKDPSLLKGFDAKHSSPSLLMVTSPYERNIFERDDQQQTNLQQTNLQQTKKQQAKKQQTIQQ